MQLRSPLSHQQPAKGMLCRSAPSQHFLAAAAPFIPASLSLNVGFGKHREEGREFRVQGIGEELRPRYDPRLPYSSSLFRTEKQKACDKEGIFSCFLSDLWRLHLQDCKTRAGFSNCFGQQIEPSVSQA